MIQKWTGMVDGVQYVIHMHQEVYTSLRDWDATGTFIFFDDYKEIGDTHTYKNERQFLMDLASSVSDGGEALSLLEKAKERMEEVKTEWTADALGFLTREELEVIVRMKYVLLPIYVCEGEETTYQTEPNDDTWVSEQIGFIYAPKEYFRIEKSYTEEELFSKDNKRTVQIGDRVRLQNQTIHQDNQLKLQTFGQITAIADGQATIDFDYGEHPSERQPDHVITVPVTEIEEVMSNHAEDILRSEVSVFDHYARGDAYWYEVLKVLPNEDCKEDGEDEEYEEIDSGDNLFGSNPFENGMSVQIDAKFLPLLRSN